MKKACYSFLLVMLVMLAVQKPLPIYGQEHATPKFLKPFFKTGESLQYAVRFGILRCGVATVKVENASQTYKEKKAIHFSADGGTAGAFNIFYKIRNRYDSFVSSDSLLPYSYIEHIQENSYKREGQADFDFQKKEVKSPKGTIAIQDNTRDILSAFYYARSLDLKGLPAGSKFHLSYYLGGSVSSLEITYLGKETISTSLGTFSCLKFSPTVKPGRVFREDSKMYLWITDDANRVPVRARAEILVGVVTMDLKSYKNLNVPLKTQ